MLVQRLHEDLPSQPARYASHHCRILELSSAQPSCLGKVPPPPCAEIDRLSDGSFIQPPTEVVPVCAPWTQLVHPTELGQRGRFSHRRENSPARLMGRTSCVAGTLAAGINMQQTASSFRSPDSDFPAELASSFSVLLSFGWAAETEFPPGPIRRRLLPPSGTVVHVKRHLIPDVSSSRPHPSARPLSRVACSHGLFGTGCQLSKCHPRRDPDNVGNRFLLFSFLDFLFPCFAAQSLPAACKPSS